MARPKKQVVDYFPHTCTSGKTIFILEQKWGNDGYAFWFKLLERLGITEGHFLDLNDEPEFLYLQSVAHMEPDVCNEILDCLSNINAIDKELWQTRRIVWSQNFVDGLADLYSRRKVDTPTRENAIGVKPLDNFEISEEEKRKIWCRNVLNRSVDSGKTPKSPCKICGATTDTQGHHYDYDLPVDVIWLCRNHHTMLHNNQLSGINVYNNPAEWEKWVNSANINPYIKVKESKVNNSKEERRPDGLERIDETNEDVNSKNNHMASKNSTEDIPLPFQELEFSQKWKEWLQYRKERRLGAYTPTGLKSTFTRLKNLCHGDPKIAIEVIEQSLANNWQGLFELKQNFNGKTNQREPSTVGKTIEFDRP